MKGLGKFQMEQMKRRAARVFSLCQHLRSAIDTLEQFVSAPVLSTTMSVPVPGSFVTLSAAFAPLVLPHEKLAYTIKEVRCSLGVGQTTIYKELDDGVLHAKRLGSRGLIPADTLCHWIAAFPGTRSNQAVCR